MTWLVLAIWTVAALGFAYVAGHSVISKPFREWLAGPVSDEGEPLIVWRFWIVAGIECPACLGTWLGFFAGLAYGIAGGPGPLWLLPFAGAFYTAGSNLLLGKLVGIMKID